MKLSYILVITLLFFSWSKTQAFQPGNTNIRECPKCKTELKQPTTGSGNTFGAIFWTDGKMFAPMLPERPQLVKCPQCFSFVWIYDAKKLGIEEVRWNNPDKEEDTWPNAVFTSVPTEEEFLDYASSNTLTTEKELYVRRSAWWLANDKVRKSNKVTVTLSEKQKSNLVRMLDLLDIEDVDQRIMKAEVYRELGKFDECNSLLKYDFKKSHHSKVAMFISQLAEQKNNRVEEIKKD